MLPCSLLLIQLFLYPGDPHIDFRRHGHVHLRGRLVIGSSGRKKLGNYIAAATAFLLVVGRSTIRGFEHFDRKVTID